MEKIGKYEILRQIGTGGFGAVYEARDPYIKRRVAIKTCGAEDDETRQRFVREAEIAGNLEHRNVTSVYDFGYTDGGVPYLVQEYLDGEDLDHRLAQGAPLATARKLDILLQIARGLDYAHRHGVIHRDVKPANMRLLEDGRVKIMDFGVALLVHVESRLTKTGITLGTAAYLPPEQIRGEKVDARADVFSFGVLAYELLAGRRPFGGKRLSEIMADILHGEPQRLEMVWPECPAGLAEVVHRCLEKEPGGRLQGFAVVIAALEPIHAALQAPEAGASIATRVLQPDEVARLERESAARERQQRVVDLLAQAREAANKGELTLAERLLESAPEADVDNAEVQRLLAEAREALRARAAQRRLEETQPGVLIAEESEPSSPPRLQRPDAAPLAVPVAPVPTEASAAVAPAPAPAPAAPTSVVAPRRSATGGRRALVLGLVGAIVGMALVALAGWRLLGSRPEVSETVEVAPQPPVSAPAPEPPPGGHVTLPASPVAGATVAIDGGAPLPLAGGLAADLAPGEHVLLFAAPGFQRAELRVAVASGEERRLEMPRLVAEAPRPRRRTPPAPPYPVPAPVEPAPAVIAEALPPPPPPVRRGDLVEPGPGVVAPRTIRVPAATYPALAKRQRQEATVVVAVLVDENGRVIEARVDQGGPTGFGFDEAALEAARRATFQPATKDGVEVKMWKQLRLGFRVR